MLQFLLVIFIIALDQITKYLAKVYIKPLDTQSIPIIRDVFHLTYTQNTGAAFSILQNQRWIFITLTIIFIIFAVYYLIKHKNDNLLLRIALSMVLAGAVGNLIDRIWLGYVVDFFDFRLINFAIFNIADTSVVIGSILLAYYLLFIAGKEKN